MSTVKDGKETKWGPLVGLISDLSKFMSGQEDLTRNFCGGPRLQACSLIMIPRKRPANG